MNVLSFYLDITIGERIELEKSEMGIQNIPDNAENIKILFSEMYSLKIQGGGVTKPLPTLVFRSTHAV